MGKMLRVSPAISEINAIVLLQAMTNAASVLQMNYQDSSSMHTKASK